LIPKEGIPRARRARGRNDADEGETENAHPSYPVFLRARPSFVRHRAEEPVEGSRMPFVARFDRTIEAVLSAPEPSMGQQFRGGLFGLLY
jgi:hypothetical protein